LTGAPDFYRISGRFSSTAIVLKILGDNGETNSEPGQAGSDCLIFQDLAIVVMVMLVPMLGGAGGGTLDIVWALTKALLIIAAVLLVARRIMPKVLEMVAKTCSPELFLLSVIAICFGTAYLTSLAGVSLSLGAFLAGFWFRKPFQPARAWAKLCRCKFCSARRFSFRSECCSI
jgi:CPA2 family monovalent cation:H+ antiporter-2